MFGSPGWWKHHHNVYIQRIKAQITCLFPVLSTTKNFKHPFMYKCHLKCKNTLQDQSCVKSSLYLNNFVQGPLTSPATACLDICHYSSSPIQHPPVHSVTPLHIESTLQMQHRSRGSPLEETFFVRLFECFNMLIERHEGFGCCFSHSWGSLLKNGNDKRSQASQWASVNGPSILSIFH